MTTTDAIVRFPRKLEIARPAPELVLVWKIRLKKTKAKLTNRMSNEYAWMLRGSLISHTSNSRAAIPPKASAVLLETRLSFDSRPISINLLAS
jgi:hypothetical protein